MSWYNSVVVSFSSAEFDGEKPPRNFGPLQKINTWLKRRRFEPLVNLNSANVLATNAVLFGGCYNYLDISDFCALVREQKWCCPDDVQILFWDDNASKFSVIGFQRRVRSRRIENQRG